MDRRKAVASIVALVAGAAGALGGRRYPGRPRQADLHLLDTHATLIAGLAETIIPATDTPGAIEAGVPAFIVKMVKEATDRRSQRNFIAGLEDTVALCRARFGRPFEECSSDERTAILRHWGQARAGGLLGRLQRRWAGRSFYELLRTYTVVGYCTSEPGARRALAYDFIPGGFHGCLPLQTGQRAWATF